MTLESATLQFRVKEQADQNRYAVSIPIGQYSAYEVKPTCGLCSDTKIIGMVDDPRYFSDPENVKALSFFINIVCLGVCTCPGDYGAVKGVYTPVWWEMGTQHGLLKQITVDAEGSYIDGIRISDFTIKDLAISYGEDITFKISAPETASHSGGLSLFGKQFGNYDQDIQVYVAY